MFNKKMFLVILMCITLLCGCGSTGNNTKKNNTYNLELIEDHSIVEKVFLKSPHLYLEPKELTLLYDEEAKIAEYRLISYYGECFIYRIKKADAYEDITSDLDIKWNIETEDIRDNVSGKTGDGTIKVDWFNDGKTTDFKGGIWFDEIDMMVYSVISLGDNPYLSDVKDVFDIGTRIEININSYEEADTFLNNYGVDGISYYRLEENGHTNIYRYQENDVPYIVYLVGDDINYKYSHYDADGNYYLTQRITDSAGNYKEIIETGLDYYYVESDYTNEGVCKRIYQIDSNDYLIISEYDDYGNTIYYRNEDSQTIKDSYYKEGKASTYVKSGDYTIDYTFKEMVINGETKYPYLTISSKYNDRYYTYASEDSNIIVKYEAYDKNTGTRYEWYLDGSTNDTDAVTLLVVTNNGSSVTYTPDQIPWGTGMMYPPKNPGDFYYW